jgi:MFS family permease
VSNSNVISLNHDAAIGSWKAWLVCLSAGLFFFYEFFQLNLFDVINQSLRDDFQISASELSWLSSTYVWANTLFLIPAGIILDRFSVRRVILVAMFICILATLGFGMSHSYGVALICRFLIGIGNAFCFLSCVVLASRWFLPRRQALVIGCVVTMAFLGGMVAHTPLAYLNERFGWRLALTIDAGAGALLIVWLLFWIKDSPATTLVSSVSSSTEALRVTLSKAIRNRQNWLCGIYTACLNLPIMVLGALWGASYLMTVHHLSEMSASNVVSFLFMGSMLGCLVMGWSSDAIGRRKLPMLIGALLTLLAFLPLYCAWVLSGSELSLVFFAIGFVTSAQVISYPCIAESNALSNTGAATGLASVIIMGGGGAGQVVFGQLMQSHAMVSSMQYNTEDYQFALWMFLVATVTALFTLLFMRETYCQRLLSPSNSSEGSVVIV